MPYFGRGQNPLESRHHSLGLDSRCASSQQLKEYYILQGYSGDESSLRKNINRLSRTDSEYHSSQTLKHYYRGSSKHDNFKCVVSNSSENNSSSTKPDKTYKHSPKEYDYSNSKPDLSYSCYSPEHCEHRESTKPTNRTFSSSKSDRAYTSSSKNSLRASSTHNSGHISLKLPNTTTVELDDDLRSIPLKQTRRNTEPLYKAGTLKRGKRMLEPFYDEVDRFAAPSKRAIHSNSFQLSPGAVYAQSKSISQLSSGPVATILVTPNSASNVSGQPYRTLRPLHYNRYSNPDDHIIHSEEFNELPRGRSRTRQPIECTICRKIHPPDVECFTQPRGDSGGKNDSSLPYLQRQNATREDRSFKTEAYSKTNHRATTGSRSYCYTTLGARPKGSSGNENSQPKQNTGPSNLGYRTRIAAPSASEDASTSARTTTRRPTTPEPTNNGQIDLYQVLNVSSNASHADIKKAYMELVLVCHPDKVDGEEKKRLAQEKFIQVTQAYDTLGDEDKRVMYDAEVRLEILRNMRKSKRMDAGGGET